MTYTHKPMHRFLPSHLLTHLHKHKCADIFVHTITQIQMMSEAIILTQSSLNQEDTEKVILCDLWFF